MDEHIAPGEKLNRGIGPWGLREEARRKSLEPAIESGNHRGRAPIAGGIGAVQVAQDLVDDVWKGRKVSALDKVLRACSLKTSYGRLMCPYSMGIASTRPRVTPRVRVLNRMLQRNSAISWLFLEHCQLERPLRSEFLKMFARISLERSRRVTFAQRIAIRAKQVDAPAPMVGRRNLRTKGLINAAKLTLAAAGMTVFVGSVMPVAPASAVTNKPVVSCDQQLVDCVYNTDEIFECCSIAFDDTVSGELNLSCVETATTKLNEPSPSARQCIEGLNDDIADCESDYLWCEFGQGLGMEGD